MIELTDTHCHIHEAEKGYKFSTETKKRYQKAKIETADEFITNAKEAGVQRMVCVGTTVEDSEAAVAFVARRPSLWASIGIHPHEAQHYVDKSSLLERFTALADQPKVVAIGECGLDFYYNHSPHAAQEKVLRFQIELALEHDLPLIFHVRGAFKEFWPIFDSYKGLRGVIHSFSSDKKDLADILKRDLYVGLNGIMTFTKDAEQLAAAKAVPIDRLLLETDAPFLTPAPERGKLCQPKHVLVTAEFLANLRGETLSFLAARTTKNAQNLLRTHV